MASRTAILHGPLLHAGLGAPAAWFGPWLQTCCPPLAMQNLPGLTGFLHIFSGTVWIQACCSA